MSQTERNLPPVRAVQSIYFIGIGGIGMSALARYFKGRGAKVAGYDRTESDLTRQLQAEGIDVHYTDDVNLILKDAEIVVFTPAVPKDHAELNFYQDNGYPVLKRSEVLGAITEEAFNICVAGTHGKTTTSTMVGHILRQSGHGCNAFLGGISTNYNTNFWHSFNDVCVVEADEYDRSFWKLSPDIAIITSMDPDHLDIYGDAKTMEDAFVTFGNKLKPGGLLISRFGLSRAREINAGRRWTYSLQNDAADVYAGNIRIGNGGYTFDVHLPDTTIYNVRLNVGGMHNVENVVAAIAAAHALEVSDERIAQAVALFRGVRRRFEYVLPPQEPVKGAWLQPVLIDDYAHHPEELNALLKSARSLFPGRRITVIFQPHLFSRTKDLFHGFATSLSLADRILLLPIYPARELPVEGVSSELILRGISREEKQLLTKEELMAWAEKHSTQLDKEFGEVIITAGAGDIDLLVPRLKEIFENA